MPQLAAFLSRGVLDTHSEMNGSGCLMLAFNWIPNSLKSHYKKFTRKTKQYKVAQWIHSYHIIGSFLYFSSLFLLLTLLFISNSRPTVVNSTCNEWKLKSPALCSTGLSTSKTLPSPHSSVLYSVLFLYISTYFLNTTLLQNSTLSIQFVVNTNLPSFFPPHFLSLPIKFPLESICFSPSLLWCSWYNLFLLNSVEAWK